MVKYFSVLIVLFNLSVSVCQEILLPSAEITSVEVVPSSYQFLLSCSLTTCYLQNEIEKSLSRKIL